MENLKTHRNIQIKIKEGSITITRNDSIITGTRENSNYYKHLRTI